MYPSKLSLQTDTYIDELVEIFLKLSMKAVQVHLIIGTTLDEFFSESCFDFWLFSLSFMILAKDRIVARLVFTKSKAIPGRTSGTLNERFLTTVNAHKMTLRSSWWLVR